MNNTPLVGDNDHGDTVPTPPQEVLRNITRERDALYANTILLLERITQLERERDAAMIRVQGILAEIDCRIEHGADSNGHLEGIRDLFKENTNG